MAFGANSRRGRCLVCGAHGTDSQPLHRAHIVSSAEIRAWHDASASTWPWHCNTIPLCPEDHVAFDDLCGVVTGPESTRTRYLLYLDKFSVLLRLRELRRSLGPGGAPPNGNVIDVEWARRCKPLLNAIVADELGGDRE